MNILVTGGAGYIGSGCAQMLLEAGHAVTVLDALVTGHRAAVPKEARFIQADLADRDTLRETLAEGKFDAVMHFAAFIEAGESMRDPGKYMQNNVSCSIALLEEIQRAGIGKFVFSSTAAVYASSDEPLSEDSPIKPSNVYGQTKLMVEQTLEWYHLVHGLRYASLRYFNAAGALPGRGEDHPGESHLIPLVLRVPLGPPAGDQDLRRRLPDPRRHRDPRLHPHRRPDLGPPAGARRAGGKAAHGLQPRQRRGVFGQAGDRCRARDHGPSDPGRGHPAPGGRRGAPGRLLGKDPPRTGLDPAHPRAARHRRERLGVAPVAPAGIRGPLI